MQKCRTHMFFSGMVQGVGFRYTVCRCAEGLPLTGWVRNLDDGRVEVLAEGEKSDIERMLQKVEERFEGYIKGKQIDYSDAENDMNGFRIVY